LDVRTGLSNHIPDLAGPRNPGDLNEGRNDDYHIAYSACGCDARYCDTGTGLDEDDAYSASSSHPSNRSESPSGYSNGANGPRGRHACRKHKS
jgi:hypothetical protein